MAVAKTTTPSSDTAAFTATFKAAGGYDAPWLVVRGDSASQLQDRVDTAIQNSLFAVIGDAAQAFAASYQAGKQLGARPVNAPVAEPQATPEPKVEEAEPVTPAEKPQEPASAPVEPATAGPWGAPATGGERPTWPEVEKAATPPADTPPQADSSGFPAAPAWAKK